MKKQVNTLSYLTEYGNLHGNYNRCQANKMNIPVTMKKTAIFIATHLKNTL